MILADTSTSYYTIYAVLCLYALYPNNSDTKSQIHLTTGNMSGDLDQHSYSTLGPVSAWVSDRLWTGKPPRRRTRHPGLLSLSHPAVGRQREYPVKNGAVNKHSAWYTSQYTVVLQCRLVSGWGLGNGDQSRRTGSGSAAEVCSRRCAIQRHVYLLTLLYFILLLELRFRFKSNV